MEFHKIRAQLTELAGSDEGKALCRELAPLKDLSEIERRQEETAAALSRLFASGNPSFGSVRDIRGSVRRLEVGSPLNAGELLTLARFLRNVGVIRQYGQHKREEEERDILDPSFEALEPLRPLSDAIDAAILSEDEIKDSASPALSRIRRQIRQAGDRIHTELARLMGSSAKDYLQDSLITTRDGRFCLPVKAGFQNHVPGIVHDTSSTGNTVFVEPAAVVRLNNEIRTLEGEEQKEIERILAALSEEAAAHSGELLSDHSLMVSLDFIFARAKLALAMNATRPLLNDDRIIDLKKARHPLIDKKKVVPIDISLGEDFGMLIITGPNTGGKTVSLKTTGLLLVMGLSGLHIPAADRSRLCYFDEIYADIGDEQSIEQSLSTFSAHMTNIVAILEAADPGSLILFDELGAGTDPTEGAALAEAILATLHERDIRTMATTHYSELKVYALRTEGVSNGACEFDVETLSPTYRLLIGVPGKSNAFAISRKLGLPEEIIDRSRGLISEQTESFEDILSALESKRKKIEGEYLAAENARKKAENLRKELEDQKKRLSEKRDKLIAQSTEEAGRILQKAKDYADQTIRYYNKHGGNASMREMEEKRSALREKIDSLETRSANPRREAPKKGSLTAADLKLGDDVKVISMDLKGTVSSLPDRSGNLTVTIGIMKTKVKLDDLEKTASEEKVKANKTVTSRGAGSIGITKSFTVSPEINLLGMTVDEAVAVLDKYLDDAAIAHLESVRIVHGKGTGALRKGIHDYLRRQKRIKSYRLGEYGEGDAGVTIATFRG